MPPRSRGARWVSVALCVALVTAAGSPAIAAGPPPAPSDPSDQDLERARELYANGTTLFEEGAYAGAALAFEQAYKLAGDTNLLYNVSLAYDRAGDFEKALEYLEYYRALAPEDERAKLGVKVESLKKRLAKQDEEGTEGSDTDSSSDAPVPNVRTRSEGDGETDTGPESDEPKIFTPAAAVLTAVTGLGLGVGIGFGASSLDHTRSGEKLCTDGGLCDIRARDTLSKARNRGIVADVAFGVAAASAIALIVVLAVNGSKRKKARQAAASARVRYTGPGLAVTF